MLAAVGALSLLLVACGGGSETAEEELSSVIDEMTEAAEGLEETSQGGSSEDGSSEDGAADLEVKPPEFHLPAPDEPPAGFVLVPAACESEDGGSWITYAVPEDWDNTSRSGGGSGSPLSTGVELGFDLADGGQVGVELAVEPRQPDGTIMTSSGEEFESFDYEYSVGDDSTTITYDLMETVTVGDQEVEIWKAPKEQAPDFVSTTEHKARFEVASLPNPAPGDDDKYMPASFVLTVSHDPDQVSLDDETVTSLVESLALPECTVDEVQVQQEIRFGEDFNGDGEVTTPEDMMEEMEQQLEELNEEAGG